MNKTFLTVFALIGIFLCGAIVGSVVSVRYARTTIQKKAAEQQLNSQQWTRLTNKLNPTSEQREKIQTIITAYMQEQQTSRKTAQTAVEKMQADIIAILTPQQKSEYERIRADLRESDKAWQRWFKEQRAKYSTIPQNITTGTAQPPAQPALTPAPSADSTKDPAHSKQNRRKQSAQTPTLAVSDTTAPSPSVP